MNNLQFHSISDESTTTSSDESKKDVETEFELFQVKELSDPDIESWVNVLYKFVALFSGELKNNQHQILKIIRSFVTDDETRLLILHGGTDKNEIKASLSFTGASLELLMYFIKISPFKKYKAEINLNGVIHFGMMNKLYQESFISLLKTIYFPGFYNLITIAPNIKISLIKSTLTCIRHFDEIKHTEFGLSSLFLPNLLTGNNTELENFESTVIDENTFKLIEDLVIRWCRQIEIAVHDTGINYTMMNVTTPMTELRMWKYKYDALNYLSLQLNDPYVMNVCKRMDCTNCAFVDRLNCLKNDLQEAIDKSAKNIKCLQILEQPCTNLNKVKNPSDIIKLLPAIFLRISVICNVCEEFGCWPKSEFLIRCLSNQIIQVCSDLINIQDAVRGKAAYYLPIISSIIDVCADYKKIFELVAEHHNNLLNVAVRWNSNLNNIFDSVDIFKDHCADLKHICHLTNIFKPPDTNQSTRTFPTCANRNLNLQQRLQEINESFQASLKEFESVQNLFSSVQNKIWHNANERHNRKMDVIQERIRELLEDAFKFITNVEEGVDLLCILHKYLELPSVRELYEQNVAKIFRMFLQQLREIDGTVGRNGYGVLKLFTVKRRLQQIYQMLKDSSGWLSMRSLSIIVDNNLVRTIGAIDQYIINEHIKWQATVHDISANQLKRPLMANSSSSLGLYEINMDKIVLKVYDDIKLWNQLGFVTPIELDHLINSMPRIMALYRNVEILLIHFNGLITGLTTEEYALFCDMIKVCRKNMNPALTTIYWDSDIANDRVNRYLHRVHEIENIVNVYKMNNVSIVNACQKICSLQFVPMLNPNNYNLDKFENEIDLTRMKTGHRLIRLYNYITGLLTNLYKELIPYIQKRKLLWLSYVETIDNLFEVSLKICSKRNLEKFDDLMRSPRHQSENKCAVNILISINLDNDQVKLISPLFELKSVINSFFLRILEVVNLVPRIYNTFKPDTVVSKPSYAVCIANNEMEQLNKQQRINTNVERAIKNVLTQSKRQWQEYEHIWIINETDFINRYKNLSEFYVKFLDQDIYAYRKIQRHLSKMERYTYAGFICIDANQFIREISNRCESRVLALVKLLEEKLMDIVSTQTIFAEKQIESLNKCPREELAALTEMLREETIQKKTFLRIIENYMQIVEKRNLKISQEIFDSNRCLEDDWKTLEILLERCTFKATYRK